MSCFTNSVYNFEKKKLSRTTSLMSLSLITAFYHLVPDNAIRLPFLNALRHAINYIYHLILRPTETTKHRAAAEPVYTVNLITCTIFIVA